MAITRLPAVYRMYDRTCNKWFLIIANDGGSAIDKAKIILGNRHRVSYESPNATADIQSIMHGSEGNLQTLIYRALRREPIPMLPSHMIENLAG
jgi:hypothetical protein